jgi:hypothetical protein
LSVNLRVLVFADLVARLSDIGPSLGIYVKLLPLPSPASATVSYEHLRGATGAATLATQTERKAKYYLLPVIVCL